MATYEERDLQRILGASYLEYQKSAPKWLLRRGKERKNRFARDKRTLYNEIPSRVEYSMTPKGQGLVEPLLSLIQWIANDKQ